MKKLIYALLLTFIILSMSFASGDIVKSFADFDGAYIPAIALTNQDKIDLSKKSIGILKKEWSLFKNDYYNYNPKDLRWKKDFDKVQTIILEAESTINSGEDLKKVHGILEEVREVFVRLRERNKIEYYIDYLNKYHEVMEKADAVTAGKSSGDISNDDINALNLILPDLTTLWNKYLNAKLDENLFKINAEKKANIKKLTDIETQALLSLKNSLEKNDNDGIIKSSSAIKPNYSKLFVTFGNFSNLK